MQSKNSTFLVYVLTILAVGLVSTAGHAATFTVDTLFDNEFSADANAGDGVCADESPLGLCTLRAAIQEANALAGADRIEFLIAGEIGPDTGNLGALPAITGDLVIDGRSAPGWSPLAPSVYLDGAAVEAIASSFAAGLKATSGELEVYGLGIVAFPGALVEFDNGADGGRIDGCVLGLDSNGDTDTHPKSLSTTGVRLHGENAVIGRHGPPGNVTGLGNVISGNKASGIEIRGDANQVWGNIIGMTLDGLTARGNALNGGAGILLLSLADSSPDNNRIGGGSPGDGAGNHIANNASAGVEIAGTNNMVDGNTFGFKPGTGVFFINSTPAIRVAGDGHTIGGSVGNRIIDRAGSGVAAIRLGFTSGTADLPATNVTVEGNEIGTDSSVGPEAGIRIAIAGSAGNTIQNNSVADATFGIDIAADGNLVTRNLLGIDPDLGQGVGPGNSQGIRIRSNANEVTWNTIGNGTNFGLGILVNAASNNDIKYNDIGFASGIGDVGNAGAGIRFINESSDNLVQGNRILNNGGPGVEFNNSIFISGNTVFGNSFQNNGGIGVDFIEFELGIGDLRGPTENDPGDADEGANRRMNHPAFGEAVPVPGTDPVETVVTFTVDSDPANQAYPITVDLYRADGYGVFSGSAFMASAVYDTFGAEEMATLTLPAGVGIDDHFTALATDADGNTSEFAPARSLGEVLFRDSYED